MAGTPPKLDKIDISKGYFETKKRLYWIQPDTLSTQRYRVYKNEAPEVLLNQDLEYVVDQLLLSNQITSGQTKDSNPISLCNKSTNITYNLANGLVDFQKKVTQQDRLLKFCALFCNYEGEDIGKYDPAVINEKVMDWDNHGFDIDGFFLLSKLALPQFREKFKYIKENESIEGMKVMIK